MDEPFNCVALTVIEEALRASVYHNAIRAWMNLLTKVHLPSSLKSCKLPYSASYRNEQALLGVLLLNLPDIDNAEPFPHQAVMEAEGGIEPPYTALQAAA